MRVLINVEIDTARGNELIASDRMGQVMQGLLEGLRPEVAYFYPRNGSRAFTWVVQVPDAGLALTSLVEPFWTQLGARVEVIPCMDADELRDGLAHLGG